MSLSLLTSITTMKTKNPNTIYKKKKKKNWTQKLILNPKQTQHRDLTNHQEQSHPPIHPKFPITTHQSIINNTITHWSTINNTTNNHHPPSYQQHNQQPPHHRATTRNSKQTYLTHQANPPNSAPDPPCHHNPRPTTLRVKIIYNQVKSFKK